MTEWLWWALTIQPGSTHHTGFSLAWKSRLTDPELDFERGSTWTLGWNQDSSSNSTRRELHYHTTASLSGLEQRKFCLLIIFCQKICFAL